MDRFKTMIRVYGGLVVVLIVGVLCAVMVCAWAGTFTEEHTTETTQDAGGVLWCAVCEEYTYTRTGTIGDVVVCGVCDSILAW